MNDDVAPALRARLSEKLADSLAAPFPDLTPRRIHGALALPNKATAVIGMRRAGKTTFLHQLRRERFVAGIPRERLPYINFEDEQLIGLAAKDLGFLLDEYYRRFPSLRGRDTVTWCLDEVQVVPGWERFVRRVLDSEKVEVFLSGSSAALLSREIATAMRGREWEVIVHPFSFLEALWHHGIPVPPPGALPARDRSIVEGAFLEYLGVGGFPEAQGLDTVTRHRLLHDYVDVAVLRDVVERHSVSNIAGLQWLVRHLLGNAGGMFSIEKFYAALKSQGISISKDTLHQLLAHLEDCFLVRTVSMESASERQRMVNPRKAYPVDPGLIPIYDRSGRANIGHALETVVLIELERRGMTTTYVRTPEGYEVDFLARAADGTTELVQVCADASDRGTAARELRALAGAAVLFPNASKRLLTLTSDSLPASAPRGIAAQPAYEWLLAGGGSAPPAVDAREAASGPGSAPG